MSLVAFQGYLFDRAELSVGPSTSEASLVSSAYERWQDALFDKLRGAFALAVWDAERERLIVGRDAMGLEPCFYCWDERVLLASTIARRDPGSAGGGYAVQSAAPRGVSAELDLRLPGSRDVLPRHPAPASRSYPVRDRRDPVPVPILGPGAHRLRVGERGGVVPLHARADAGRRSLSVRRRRQRGAERRIRLGQRRRGRGRRSSWRRPAARRVAALHRCLMRRGPRPRRRSPERWGCPCSCARSTSASTPSRSPATLQALSRVSPNPVLSPWQPMYSRLLRLRCRSGAQPPHDGYRRRRDVLRQPGATAPTVSPPSSFGVSGASAGRASGRRLTRGCGSRGRSCGTARSRPRSGSGRAASWA